MHFFSLSQLSSGWSSTQCGCCRRSWHRVCWNSSLQSLLLKECTARGTRVSTFFFLGICSWTFPLTKWWSDQQQALLQTLKSQHSHLCPFLISTKSIVCACLVAGCFQVARCTYGFLNQVFMTVRSFIPKNSRSLTPASLQLPTPRFPHTSLHTSLSPSLFPTHALKSPSTTRMSPAGT